MQPTRVLALTNVTPASAGLHSVLVTNAFGSVGSSNALLTVWLQPLLLSAPFYDANSRFGFTLTGSAGQLVVIEASEDLYTWTPVQTNTLGAARFSFTEVQSAPLSNRFYRVRSTP